MNINCIDCHTPFKTITRKRKLCTTCKRTHKRASNRRFYQDNVERIKTKNKLYNREYRKKHKNIVKKKIEHYKDNDRKYNRKFLLKDYMTPEWVAKELENCNNKCGYCEKDLKLENYDKQDKDMFSCDRKDPAKAHVIKPVCNVLICCNFCNHQKQTKTYLEFLEFLDKQKNT